MRGRSRTWAWAGLVGLVASGCAVVRSDRPLAGSPPASKARVAISIPRWEALAKGNIWVVEGDRLVAKLFPGRYVVEDLEPGVHEFTSLGEFGTVGTIRGELEAGRTYRLRLEPIDDRALTVPSAVGTPIMVPAYTLGWRALEPGSDDWADDAAMRGLSWGVESRRNGTAKRKGQSVAKRARASRARLSPVEIPVSVP